MSAGSYPLSQKKGLWLIFTKGIISGSKAVKLVPKENHILLEVKWDIKLTGINGHVYRND